MYLLYVRASLGEHIVPGYRAKELIILVWMQTYRQGTFPILAVSFPESLLLQREKEITQ